MNESQSDDIDVSDLLKTAPEPGHTVTRIRFATFAARLKEVMDARKLRPWHVAGALEVSGQMVGKYLRGESLPSLIKLKKLSAFLEMPLSELLEGTPISPDDVVRRRSRIPKIDFVTADGRVVKAKPAPDEFVDMAVPVRVRVFDERERTMGSTIRQIVFYRTREKLEFAAGPEQNELTTYTGPVSRRPLPATRLVKEPIDEGRYFDLRPDMAFASPGGWKFAIEVKTGRPSLESLVGFATNWKASTSAPLFLVIAKLRSPSEQIGLFDDYDDYDEALIGTSMEPGRYQPPARLDRPPLPRRYTWALDEMVRGGLFKGVSVVYFNRQTERLGDSFPDAFGFDAMLEQVAETALT
jgi:transcriptional regulator with XRE-family HTH domain